jgi:hypothetical protein
MRPTVALRLWIVGLLLCVLAAEAAPGLAQSGDGYDLTWSTIGGGVSYASGSGYQLGGTAGQLDTGVLSGGGYTLSGGFWGGGKVGNPHRIYLPLTVKNP